MKKRFVLMDSARGIAAISVLFIHCWTSFVAGPEYRTLNIIFAKLPVLVFFVLSGFVLSYSLKNALSRHKLGSFNIISQSKTFYIKRFFRIIPLIIFSLLSALVISRFYTVPVVSSAAGGLKYFITMGHNIDHYGLIVNFFLIDPYVNPPLWTMRPELAFSLIAPLLVMICLNNTTIQVIAFSGFALIMFFFGGIIWWIGIFGWLFPFYLGVLISFYDKAISGLPKVAVVSLLLLLGFMLLIVLTERGIPRGNGLLLSMVASGIIVLCLWGEGTWLGDFFSSAPFRFLGRISFSLYILHSPCIFLVWVLLERHNPEYFTAKGMLFGKITLFILASLISVPFACIVEKYVERPFNKLGHILAQRAKGMPSLT